MNTYTVGDRVRVLPPFDVGFPGIYTVAEVVIHDDGSVAYILDQDAGGFDAIYLEPAP